MSVENEITLACEGVYFPGSGTLEWDLVGDPDAILLSSPTRISPSDLDFTAESSLVVDLNSCIPKLYRCTVTNSDGLSLSQTANICLPREC